MNAVLSLFRVVCDVFLWLCEKHTTISIFYLEKVRHSKLKSFVVAQLVGSKARVESIDITHYSLQSQSDTVHAHFILAYQGI